MPEKKYTISEEGRKQLEKYKDVVRHKNNLHPALKNLLHDLTNILLNDTQEDVTAYSMDWQTYDKNTILNPKGLQNPDKPIPVTVNNKLIGYTKIDIQPLKSLDTTQADKKLQDADVLINAEHNSEEVPYKSSQPVRVMGWAVETSSDTQEDNRDVTEKLGAKDTEIQTKESINIELPEENIFSDIYWDFQAWYEKQYPESQEYECFDSLTTEDFSTYWKEWRAIIDKKNKRKKKK